MPKRALPLILLLAACSGSAFDRVSYFKDDGPNRVMVLVASRDASPEEAEQHAEQLMHTDGRLTIAYLYEPGTALGDPITMAANFATANQIMFEADLPPWRWRFIRGADGSTTFYDCQAEPGDEGHCRS